MARLALSPAHTSTGVALAVLLALPLAAAEDDAFVVFSQRVEETVGSYDPSFLDASFDLDALMETVTRDIDVDRDFERNFCMGVRSAFTFATPIVESNSRYDGTYKFLRMLPGEPPRALFRFAGDDGLNYHELYLRRDERDQVRIVDVYVHATGETLSETLRHSFLSVAASMNRGLLGSLFADDSYLEALCSVPEVLALLEIDPSAALKLYDSFPEEARREPMFLMIRLRITSMLGDEAYLATLTEFAKQHPDSAALDLLQIDSHLMRGDYDKALASIDRVDERVLGDPYLDIMRGNLLLMAGAPDKARALAQAATVRDPELEYQASWLLLNVALVERDHAATLVLLSSLEEDFGIEWIDFTDVPEYAAFVESDEHRAWLAR